MSQNRIEWIDLVRAIAILTVLYIHATDGIYIIDISICISLYWTYRSSILPDDYRILIA